MRQHWALLMSDAIDQKASQKQWSCSSRTLKNAEPFFWDFRDGAVWVHQNTNHIYNQQYDVIGVASHSHSVLDEVPKYEMENAQ